MKKLKRRKKRRREKAGKKSREDGGAGDGTAEPDEDLEADVLQVRGKAEGCYETMLMAMDTNGTPCLANDMLMSLFLYGWTSPSTSERTKRLIRGTCGGQHQGDGCLLCIRVHPAGAMVLQGWAACVTLCLPQSSRDSTQSASLLPWKLIICRCFTSCQVLVSLCCDISCHATCVWGLCPRDHWVVIMRITALDMIGCPCAVLLFLRAGKR